MGIETIIALILAAVGALVGSIVGHARGKSVGKTQGAAEANAGVILTQSQSAAKAAKERAHVEVGMATADDDELDRRLSKHDRPG